MQLLASFAALLFLLPLAIAQSGAWAQCSGVYETTPGLCIARWTCTYSNPWYSQCLPASSTTTTSTTSTTSTSTSTVPSASGLAKLAKAAGKLYFGSAMDNPELTDTPYVAQLSNTNDFIQITLGNTMKWYAAEPSRGTFDFTQAEAVTSLAHKNGQLIRGRGLAMTAETLTEILQDTTVSGIVVVITELDIRMTLPVTNALLAQQEKDYQTVIAAPKCIGITIWEWTDKYSWVPGVFSGQGGALPWDGNFVSQETCLRCIVTGLTA